MKKFEDYGCEDFAIDNDFIAWCIAPTEESDRFWRQWIQSHPKQRIIIKSAKQLVLDLNKVESEEQEMNFEKEIWEGIENNLAKEKTIVKSIPGLWKWIAAACVLFMIGTSVWLNQKVDTVIPTVANQEWINFENNSGNAKSIVLADSSIVTVEPFGVLKYPTVFEDEQRMVFLKGEAFFDITRDTLKPFLVYANETITKVLGTSFRITAFEGEETVEVQVKTGKVAVYANVNKKASKKELIIQADETITIPRPNKKIEITPNQKVVFNRKAEDMIKTVARAPQFIKTLKELPQFEFTDESVVKVFETLELAYGIELDYNKEDLNKCTITTKLNNESLFEKLNIICIALDLSFEEKDATIFIEGKGCE